MHKVVLVTGANRGIGFDTCRGLHCKGATVVVGSRNAALGEEAVRKLMRVDGPTGHHHHMNHPTVVTHQLDVTDPESIRKTVHYIKKHYGRIDAVVNNASVNITGWNQKTFNEVVNTNFEGVVRVTEAVLPMMKEQNYGRIVNMTSIMGNVENLSRKIQFVLMHEREKWTTTDQIRKALKFDASDLGSKSDPNSAFNISKAMLNAYTSVVAKQLEKDGFSDIKVNGVIPALYTPPAPAHPTAPAHPLLNKVFGAPKPRSTVGLSAEEPYGWANKSHVVEAVIHLATDEKLNLNGKIFNESLQVVRGW